MWYGLSKTLAEESAWKFSKDNGIEIVTINPSMVIGPLLQPTLNTSSAVILNLINGMLLVVTSLGAGTNDHCGFNSTLTVISDAIFAL